MYHLVVKNKPWTVRLAEGYVLDGEVRSEGCGTCPYSPKMLVAKNDKSKLALFGCDAKKCKHMLMRVDLSPTENQLLSVINQDMTLQPNSKLIPLIPA